MLASTLLSRLKHQGWRLGFRLFSAFIVSLTCLSLIASATKAMPPPAPGNTEGLPQSVREKLQENPDLFYMNNGFRNVIERQKRDKDRIFRELVKDGMSLKGAQAASLSRVTTTRFAPVLCGLYSDKVTPDWPVADLVDQLFSLDYGETNTMGHPGSMREHYLDMSYGTFDLQGGVFGWYPLPQPGT
ncbi:MAG: hypothetical protein HKN21_08060, partial [Candidatus Eisenbacteria bacterium]|nr:hypothetical protein [Candidatus Eisenbacteria bacterium]